MSLKFYFGRLPEGCTFAVLLLKGQSVIDKVSVPMDQNVGAKYLVQGEALLQTHGSYQILLISEAIDDYVPKGDHPQNERLKGTRHHGHVPAD